MLEPDRSREFQFSLIETIIPKKVEIFRVSAVEKKGTERDGWEDGGQ